jgi:hypothetical protein
MIHVSDQEVFELDLTWRDMIVTLRGAESYAGDRLRGDLRTLRELSMAVVTRVARLIQAAPKLASESSQAATAATYLGSLLDDLRATDAIICSGYPTVALSVVAGLIDGVAMLEEYGTSKAASQRFFEHDNEEYPGAKTRPLLRRLAERVAQELDVDAESLGDTLQDWYRIASAAKHKNPVVMQQQIQNRGAVFAVHSGPSAGGEWTRRAQDALTIGTLVLIFGALAFGKAYNADADVRNDLSSLAREIMHDLGVSSGETKPDHDDGNGSPHSGT